MRAGDLISIPGLRGIGLIVEIRDSIHVPPAAVILWSDGSVFREYTDELQQLAERGN